MENKKIIYYKQLDSTNTEITRLAAQGAEHGTVVVADAQTAGKGRRGRQWESPAGENIYMSVLLRPDCLPDRAPMLTLVMAYSVAKVLKELGFLDVQIKWPNDLVLSAKKICGILTEMQLKDAEIDYVVVGVGINVNTSKFPEELNDTATSLYLESGRTFDREGIVESVVFKGVHYEMIIDGVDHKWTVHSTKAEAPGSMVGLAFDPFDIHIMKKSEE